MRRKKKYWLANNYIKVPELRVIGEKGKLIGVLPTQEALSKAKKAGLDLVVVARGAKPPVAKIIDLGKFRYQEEKKERDEKKRAKHSELKEIRFSPFIADNDYKVRLGRIDEFLAENHKIRVVVVFKGRQMGSKQFGYSLLQKILSQIEYPISIDMEPKFLGRHLVTVISPTKKARVVKKKENAKTKN